MNNPHRWAVIGGTALLLLLGCTRTLAQEFELSGQIRPRLETADHVDVDGEGDAFVSMRSRLGVEATISPALRAFAQIQDVRLWGGEFSTTDADADMLDLHQAWVELGRADATTLRLGRQEVRYGNERLIGAADWVQQARAFDGVRVSHPVRGARVDGFWFQLADATAGTRPDGATLAGLYATVPLGEHAAEAFGLWNTDAGTSQGTVGGRVLTRFGDAFARFEGAAQFGERFDQDVSAHLFSAEIGLDVLPELSVSGLYDRLSGDDDLADDERHVFDTLFGTNHRFYGHADRFLNIPLHTSRRGLLDIALRSAWKATPSTTVTLDLHRFAAAAGDGMDDDHFADEADLVVAWCGSSNLGVSGGVFWFDPADGYAEIVLVSESFLATYLALDVTF